MKKTSICKWHNQKCMLAKKSVQSKNDHLAFATSIIGDQLGKIQSKVNESQVKWFRYSLYPVECII